MRKDPTEFRERFKRWKLGLPAYKDGKRYIKNDDDTWTRITDDQMADLFANLVVTPSTNREEIVVRRPDTYDALLRKSIHNAGYVTDWQLEQDAANRRKLAMAARHAEDTGMDNNMTEFFKTIKDIKYAAKWMSVFHKAIIPAAITGAETYKYLKPRLSKKK